jgi:putrescine---pyruvate transaminase
VLVGQAVRAPLEADAAFVLRHGYTFSGHPAAAAAGLANLDIYEREGLASHAEVVARRLGTGLEAMVDGDTVVAARGMAGIWALGLGNAIDATEVRDRLMDIGVIARPLGTSTLAFCPPLVINDEQMDRCVEGARKAIAEVAGRR